MDDSFESLGDFLFSRHLGYLLTIDKTKSVASEGSANRCDQAARLTVCLLLSGPRGAQVIGCKVSGETALQYQVGLA